MGLFDILWKKQQKVTSQTDGVSLLDKYDEGLLDDKSFLNAFGKVNVFYSTPFGDHKDGGSRLFALQAKDGTGYLPVFTSTERTMEFYEKAGRLGFLIMEGSFSSFLESIKKMNSGNTPVKMGAIIDPGYYGLTFNLKTAIAPGTLASCPTNPVFRFNANVLDVVIDMTK